MIVRVPDARWLVLASAMLLVGVAVVRVTACGPERASRGSDRAPGAPVFDEPLEPAPATDTDPAVTVDPLANDEVEPAPAADEPLGRMQAIVYFPDRRSRGLIGEPREIFRTASPADRAKQIVADLIAGPQSDRGLRAVPASVTLRQVYVLDDGTAWVDLGGNLTQEMSGGTRHELLVVYAIVNSVAGNVAEVRRVGILVDGRPIDTLTGHIDLRRPLPQDRSLVVGTADVDDV